MKKIFLVLLALGFAALCSQIAYAGWVLKQNTNGKSLTIYISKNMARTAGDRYSHIFNSKTGQVTVLDMAQARYWTGDPAVFGKEVTKKIAELFKENIPRMPPKMQREMRLKLGLAKRTRPPKVKVIDEGEHTYIAGYQARHYLIMADGEIRMDIWLANIPDLLEEISAVGLLRAAIQIPGGLDNF